MKMDRTLSQMFILMLAVLAVEAQALRADDWPRFRGPNGSGVAQADGLPMRFGAAHNVVWRTELPAGHSSPILSDEHIYLTASLEEELLVLSLDRKSGRILWRRRAPRARHEKLDRRNNPAAPSPTTDGDNAYVFFPDYGLLSYDSDGTERWRIPLGPFNNVYGMGASPILAGDLVVLVCDQSTGSFVIAVGKDDGKVRWKTARPEATSGHSTPVLYRSRQGASQLIVPGSFLLTGYSVETGQREWWVGGLSFEMKSTPVLSHDTVYVNGYATPRNQPGRQTPTSPFEDVRSQHDANQDGRLSKEELPKGQARSWLSFTDLDGDGSLDSSEWDYYRAAAASRNGLLAIRAGGRGDMTEGGLLWHYRKAVPQLPSPLLFKGILYLINDGGIVTTLNPQTGDVIAQGRLKGAVDNYYASPVAGDDKVYMVSELGKVAVLGSDGSLEVQAVNDLDDLCYATPAIVSNRIYLRTRSALYCFGR